MADIDHQRLRFDLTRDDVRAYFRHALLKTARGRRFMRIERVGLLGLLTLIGALRGVSSGDWKMVVFSGLIALVLGIPAAWLVPWILRNIQAGLSTSSQVGTGAIVGHWEYEIRDEGLYYERLTEPGCFSGAGSSGWMSSPKACTCSRPRLRPASSRHER